MLSLFWSRRSFPRALLSGYVRFPTRQFSTKLDASDVQSKTTTDVKTLQVAKKRLLTQIEGLSDQREYELKRLLSLHIHAIFTHQVFDVDDAKALVGSIFQNYRVEDAQEFVRDMETIQAYFDLDRPTKKNYFGEVHDLDLEMKELDSYSRYVESEIGAHQDRLNALKISGEKLSSSIQKFQNILERVEAALEQVNVEAMDDFQKKKKNIEFKFVIGGDSRYAKAKLVNRLLGQDIFPTDSANLSKWCVIVEVGYRKGVLDVEWIGERVVGTPEFEIKTENVSEELASDGYKRIRCFVDSPLLKSGLKIVMLNVHKDEDRSDERNWMIEEIQKSCLQVFVLHLDDTKQVPEIKSLGKKVSELLLYADMKKSLLVISNSGFKAAKTDFEVEKFRQPLTLAGFKIPLDYKNAANIAVIDLDGAPKRDFDEFEHKLVPYLKIWSAKEANELLKFVQREMVEHVRPLFSGRTEWKALRFQEIHMAEEFLRSLQIHKAWIMKELEEKAQNPMWIVDEEDSVTWDDVFQHYGRTLEQRQQKVLEIAINQFKLLMVENVHKPFQKIMVEWSALFSKNLHVEELELVDFSLIPNVPSIPKNRHPLIQRLDEVLNGESELDRFKKEAWEKLHEMIKDQVDRRFEVLFNTIQDDLESLRNARDSDILSDGQKSFKEANEHLTRCYNHFEEFWRAEYKDFEGNYFDNEEKDRYLTQKFHPPQRYGKLFERSDQEQLFEKSCQELFALLLCGSLPRIPELGSVLGIRKDSDRNLEFVSDSKKSEYQLFRDVWSTCDGLECPEDPYEEIKIKRSIILQLFKICRHLRNTGLDLATITPETLALNKRRSSVRLVSLKGANFIGMGDSATPISGDSGLSVVAQMIASILKWRNELGKKFEIPENADAVLPGLRNLLKEIVEENGRPRKSTYRTFIHLIQQIESFQPKWNILTMDGGGARGIVSALILKELEEKMRSQECTSEENYRLWNIFHLIGGTSAGGLNALAVGVLKKPAVEIVPLAADLANTINFSWFRRMFTNSATTALEKKLILLLKEEEIGEPVVQGAFDPHKPVFRRLSSFLNWNRDSKQEETMLNDKYFIGKCGVDPHLFVTTVRLLKQDSIIVGETICNFDVPGQKPSPVWKVWEVARATSAAPNYFSAYYKDWKKYRDGGIAANNPTLEAINLAAKFQQDVNILVSIGTGTQQNYFDQVRRQDTIFSFPGKVVDWLTETESTHRKVASLCAAKSVQYFRFQPELSVGLLKMHLNNSEIEELKDEVALYLSKRDVQQRLDRLAKLLVASVNEKKKHRRVPSGSGIDEDLSEGNDENCVVGQHAQ
jgi:predicted acylesterase/phospholipase RssA